MVAVVSRAYNFFLDKVGHWPWKPLLGKTSILPKHRFALMLFAHGKFPTRDRLGAIPDKSCVLCKVANESFRHLFFNCTFSKDVWSRIRQWLGMRRLWVRLQQC